MSKNGQTLIEIAIALGISTIVIVALVILAASGLRNAQDTIRRSESSKIANAGIEAVIYYKNALGFSSALLPQNNGEKYCYTLLGSSFGTSIDQVSCSINQTGAYDKPGYVEVVSPSTNLAYWRKITVEKTSSYQYEVLSTVDWVVSGDDINSVSVKRVLTDWR